MSIIRKAEEKDIPKIMELLVQVNMVHHNARPDLFKGPTTKYTEEELRGILSDESSPVFVYEDDGGCVQGHCFGMITKADNTRLLEEIKTFYIDDICVDENARGKRVGDALFQYAKNYAKEIGCYNLTLNVWTGNEGAKAFYEKCGLKTQKTGMEMVLQ